MSGFNNKPNIGQQLGDNITGGNVAGIFSTAPSARYSSGARTLLKVNGKLCGFAFGISWRINTQVTEINTVDDYMPYELAPQRLTVEGTMSALHIPGQSAGSELWQPDSINFLFNQYIQIEVRDSESDKLLFFTNKAMVVSRQETIQVDQLSNVQLAWRAIGYQDERPPELAEGYNKPTKKTEPAKGSRLQSEALDAVRRQGGGGGFNPGGLV
jgi:hypothetical protein